MPATITAPTYPYTAIGSGRSGSAHQIVKAPAVGGSLAPDYPAQTNVRNGVHYGNLSFTGNMTEPAISDVRNGVQYGANGTEFTGTLRSGSVDGWVS